MNDDKHHDGESRRRAWYVALHNGRPITTSRGLYEGPAIAKGRKLAGDMLRQLRKEGAAPVRGVRLVPLGHDGVADLDGTLDELRDAGGDCYFTYGKHRRDWFTVHELD